MSDGWRRLSLLLPFLLWVGSILALLQALRANEAAGLLMRVYGGAHIQGRAEHLHALAVMWTLVLTGLQLAAMVVGAMVLRGWYRLRSAVCFALSGGALIALNTLWLLGLLVRLRVAGELR